VLRIVLPAITSSLVDIVDRVLVEVVIVVDGDVRVVPIAIPPVVVGPCGTQGNACPPSQRCPRLISRIGVRIIGILGRRRPINNLRIV